MRLTDAGAFGGPELVEAPALEAVRFDQSLPALHRLLLTSDGTVTRLLEAYAAEPIYVVKLAHVLIERPGPPCPELELGDDEALLRRAVLLRGEHSGTNFLHAEALLAADRLPSAVLQGLGLTDRPVGALLAEHRVETWRQLMASGLQAAGSYGAHFQLGEEATVLFRSYRVFSEKRPVMMVTERFPTTAVT